MLSFSRGRIIAKVSTPNQKTRYLRVHEPTTKEKKDPMSDIKVPDVMDVLTEEEIRSMKKHMKPREMGKMIDFLNEATRPNDEDYEDMYDLAMEKFTQKSMTEFKTPDGYLTPIPRIEKGEKQRDCIYICAPSGGGKSTFCRMYLENFKQVFPKRPIYVFSRVKHDTVLDEMNPKPKRIMINDELVDEPLESTDFNKCCVVFDDIDTIQEKKQKVAVEKLRDDMLQIGRHNEIYLLCTSHQLMNYKSSRTLLNESTAVVFFPKSGSQYHIQRYLKVYAGCNKKQIEKIIALPSRWIMHNKTYPNYILYESGCYLMNE
jgi:hypothetical protein